MKNPKVADLFNEIATLLELKGENPFRVRAYQRAALNVSGFPRDVGELSDEDLRAIPGLGPDLAGKIREFLSAGRIEVHEELKKAVPPGLLEILRVPGVGPKTARMLFETVGVRNLEDLASLAREGKLKGLPGIQARAEENIRKGIETVRKGKERVPLGKGRPIAWNIVEALKAKAPVGKVEVAGSVRRWRETIKDIDIVATSKKPEEVMAVYVSLPAVRQVLAHGPTKSTVVTEDGIQADLRVVEEGSFGAALQYLTGSKAHNVKLREMAVKAGLKINEYGIFRESDGKKLGGRTEEEMYAALKLPYIPPEMREDTGEIEAAGQGKLPRLLELEDIRGDLHVHTKWSDGAHDLGTIVEAARKKGYEYVAITDHSKGLGVAHGLDEKRLMEEIDLIERANGKAKGFRILSGIEVDIRADGSLDLPDEVLSKLDIVVASIHSGFKQPREQITRRLVSAIRNPLVGVIGHPTGRLIGEREPYDADMEAVFKEAAGCGVAMEVNAHPVRLDLNDYHIRMARRYGIPIVISTDTHVTSNLDYMIYGVSTARRGWLTKGDVLNTLPYKTLVRRLRSGRNPAATRNASHSRH